MADLKNTEINDNLELPSGTTGERPSSPQEGQIRYNTDLETAEFYNGENWRPLSDTHPEAAGGTVVDTDIGGVPYRIHYFTETGTDTLTVTNPGEVECLIVAGGGGAGRSGSATANSAGGGGGGGVIIADSLQLSATTYSIEVGTGGSGTTTVAIQPGNGGNSSAFGLTALGGGAGGVRDFRNGADGGSGGGAGSDNSSNTGSPGQGIQSQQSGDSGNFGYGNSGGNVDPNGDPTGNPIGGGGGGAGAAANGIVGGPGIFDLKTTKMFASGGSVDVNGSSPGSTATGNGATAPGGNSQQGSDGGSGIVIVRYPRNSSLDTEPDRTVVATQPQNFQTVRDGLVLELDAGDPVSYPGSGSTVKNLAGNTDSDLVGGTDFLPIYGGIFRFDGIDDRIETNIDLNLDDNTDFVYTAWYRNEEENISSSSNDAIISNYASSSTTPNVQLHLLAGGTVRFFIRNSGGSTGVVENSFRIDDAQWHHLVATLLESTMYLYVDGDLIGTDSSPGGTVTSGQTITVGSGHLNRFHPNEIGLAQIYRNKGFTQEEVTAHFNQTRGRFGV